jgi:hypothetical protein
MADVGGKYDDGGLPALMLVLSGPLLSSLSIKVVVGLARHARTLDAKQSGVPASRMAHAACAIRNVCMRACCGWLAALVR